MGRHQQHGSARGARFALGVAALAGLMSPATYALAAPAAPLPAPTVSPVVLPVDAGHAPVRTGAVTTTCDLDAPPVFGDPAHPDEITNRDCGYVDAQGRQRSHDAWIDDQLR